MPGRLFKQAVQQDHHERPGQAYLLMYVESLGAARTMSPVGCSKGWIFPPTQPRRFFCTRPTHRLLRNRSPGTRLSPRGRSKRKPVSYES